MGRKPPPCITAGKFMDNSADTGRAISLAKRYERLVQRIIEDGYISPVTAMEHSACRSTLADLIGVRDINRDAPARPTIQLSLDNPTTDEPRLVRPIIHLKED